MRLYTLTDMTGRKSDDDRTMSVMTVNVRPKVLLVGALSAFAAIPVTMTLWVFIHELAVIAIPVVVGSALWLFTSKTNDSRQISNFRALGDKMKAKNSSGKIFVGMTEVDIAQSDEFTSVPGSVPKNQVQTSYRRGRASSIDDVFK